MKSMTQGSFHSWYLWPKVHSTHEIYAKIIPPVKSISQGSFHPWNPEPRLISLMKSMRKGSFTHEIFVPKLIPLMKSMSQGSFRTWNLCAKVYSAHKIYASKFILHTESLRRMRFLAFIIIPDKESLHDKFSCKTLKINASLDKKIYLFAHSAHIHM